MTHKPQGNKIEKRKNGEYEDVEDVKEERIRREIQSAGGQVRQNFGSAKAAAEELQIPVNTLYGWIQKVKTAELDIGCGERSPEEALSIAKENQQLKKRIKALEKENRRLSEMNEFLEDAAAFFAASRQKSGNIAYRTDDGKRRKTVCFGDF